jgi:hypothetical protein
VRKEEERTSAIRNIFPRVRSPLVHDSPAPPFRHHDHQKDARWLRERFFSPRQMVHAAEIKMPALVLAAASAAPIIVGGSHWQRFPLTRGMPSAFFGSFDHVSGFGLPD